MLSGSGSHWPKENHWEAAVLEGHKILVTGLTGNLGGSIAQALVSQNDLWGFARYSREGQRDYWNKAGVHTVVGDCAEGSFAGLPDDFDYVIHSAANTQPASFEDGMRDNAVGSALLMGHCRSAKAFMHISAAAVYAQYPERDRWYAEEDLTGSASMGHYGGTKLAAEGAVRAMARYLDLPTIICRLGVQYGVFSMGGLPGVFLSMILRDQTIPLPAEQSNLHMLISDDDVVRFLEPTLQAARVPAVTINYAGDEPVSSVDLINYLGELANKTPKYVFSDELNYPTVKLDPTRRKAITGPCQVEWREGVQRMYEGLKGRSYTAGSASSVGA
jgi:UDP-glucuronate 4-epimerase